jgi:hypothetical protein
VRATGNAKGNAAWPAKPLGSPLMRPATAAAWVAAGLEWRVSESPRWDKKEGAPPERSRVEGGTFERNDRAVAALRSDQLGHV